MSSPKSKSPKRSQSPKKKTGKSAEDALLEQRMTANVVEPPTGLFMGLGAAVSILPVYLAVFLFDVPLTVTHLALFAFVAASVTYMLQKAYSILFFCEFMKRDVPYSEIKSQQDANDLRALRLELSMAKTVFQVNLVFIAISSALQLYVFKNIDPRASLLMAPMFAGFVSWFVAYKSEESRKAALK